jgi:alpha-glucosidase
MSTGSLAERPVDAEAIHPWEGLTVYEVYLRSFAEAGRDQMDRGEGNLRGITSKLDYLQRIGVDAIWVTPFYPSPMVDGGYDVEDHCDVDERFGTLEDFDELVAEAHGRGMRIVVDLVLNHTSNRHPKFLGESQNPAADPATDWYVWDGGRTDEAGNKLPPNNWVSAFSQPQGQDVQELVPPSAWKYHQGRKMWYLHSFAEEQPDLNWDNPEVQAEVQRIMRFWIARGVDGFRVDAFDRTAKNMTLADEVYFPGTRDGRVNPYYGLAEHNSCGYPGTLFRNLELLNSVVAEFSERDLYMIIETNLQGEMLKRLNALAPRHLGAFNFRRLDTAWNAGSQRAQIDAYSRQLPPGAVGNQVIGNHDRKRITRLLGADAARAAMVVLRTLPGMKAINQGDEGLLDQVDVPPELRVDIHDGRDGSRIPMPWNRRRNGGFSRALKTWLPIYPDYRRANMAAQERDPRSALNLFKRLSKLIGDNPSLRYGAFDWIETDNPEQTLSYTRTYDGKGLVVLANMSNSPAVVRFTADMAQSTGRVLLSSSTDRERRQRVSFKDGILLAPDEAVIIM